MAEIAGLDFGALPIAVLLYQSAVEIFDILSPAQNLGDDFEALVSALRNEKRIFSRWGKGCGLDKPAKHVSGWYGREDETLLGALTRMFIYLAKAYMLVERYVDAGGGGCSQNLPDMPGIVSYMRGAGYEELAFDIQRTWNELQTSRAKTGPLLTSKILRPDPRQADELTRLLVKIRQLNINLERVRLPTREVAEGRPLPN